MSIEKLEPRRLLTTTVNFYEGLLTIDNDNDSHSIVVKEVNSTIQVFEDDVRVYMLVGKSSLVNIEISGHGGDDYISVAGLTSNWGVTVFGGDGNDTIKGTIQPDTLDGGAGDDSINGMQKDDLLIGGDGNDTLLGHYGHDTLVGGDGFDIVTYADANPGAINVSLNGLADDKQDVYTDWLHGDIEGVIGTVGRDTIIGNDGDNFIDGGSENDKLYGLAGNDTLLTGIGSDYVEAGDGDDFVIGTYETKGYDTIFGGAGNDFFAEFTNARADILNGGDGIDTLSGSASEETDSFIEEFI